MSWFYRYLGAGPISDHVAQEQLEQLVPTSTTEPIITLEPTIDTEDPAHGWSVQNAQWNADRLRDYLGRDRYDYAVLPTRCPGRYGFVIQERDRGSTLDEFFTNEQVTTCRKQRR